MADNKRPTTLTQKDYQRKYDEKTKTISIKYVLSDMKDYNRLKDYLDRTGKSANGFIKELINDFFEHKKYEMNDKRVSDYFKDYNTSGEWISQLIEVVGEDRYNIIMECNRKIIENELYNAFIDRGDALDEWIEQFLDDIENGYIDINIPDKEFERMVDENISDYIGNIYFG